MNTLRGGERARQRLLPLPGDLPRRGGSSLSPRLRAPLPPLPVLFCARGKMRLRGQVYRSYWTGNRWRPIVDRFGCGASFSSIMLFKLRPGSQDPNPPVWMLRWHSLGRGLISAHQMRMSAYPPIADIQIMIPGQAPANVRFAPKSRHWRRYR